MTDQWVSTASLMGLFALSQTVLQTFIPPELRSLLSRWLQAVLKWLSVYLYFDIAEVEGVTTNELYEAVQLYLSNSASVALTARRVNLSRPRNSTAFTFSLSNNDKIVDRYKGITVWWEHHISERQNQPMTWRPLPDEKRRFVLCFHKKHKSLIMNSYLEHIMERAQDVRRINRDRLLYTNSKGGWESRSQGWESVPFKHPSTFDTLAMDPLRKSEIMDDLRAFVDGQEFYQKTGRSWKRGYLLYGPPGTGKSSMIAAMANFLCYDVYDLELTEVRTNAELRKLLVKTTNKSIIVIEDIDCSINLSNRAEKPNPPAHQPALPDPGDEINDPNTNPNNYNNNNNNITLSGLLNFTDGLWSCCGSERIFVFTTNHVEKLDPALLRSGRMDMRILMSYCSFPAFKILAGNYLGIHDHPLFADVEDIIDGACITPADVSEILVKNRHRATKALEELLQALKASRESSSAAREENPADEDEEQEKRALDSPHRDSKLAAKLEAGRCARCRKKAEEEDEKDASNLVAKKEEKNRKIEKAD